MSNTTISVPEIHCDHCVHSISGAVGGLDGVESVEVDLTTKEVRVAHDDAVASVEALVAAIEEQGYEVPGDDAPERLPMA